MAQKIAEHLNILLSDVTITKFFDGETAVELSSSVKGLHLFVVQSLAFQPNEFLMELLIIVDAAKRAGAKAVTAIIPYLAYARQDRTSIIGTPLTAKLVANLLKAAGVDSLIAVDMHTDQLEGFFDFKVINIHAWPLFEPEINRFNLAKTCLVAPDIGGAKMAERVSNLFGLELAIIKKTRAPAGLKVQLIGDIQGRRVIILDDICSSASTLISAAKLCQQSGATEVTAMITHALFSQTSVENLKSCGIRQLYATDTVCMAKEFIPFAKVVTVSNLIAQKISEMVC